MLKDESGNVGTLMAVFMSVIILVAIAVAFVLAGVIGSSVENAIPAIPAGSAFNSTENPAIVTGAEIWTTQGALLSAVVIVAVAAMVLTSLFSIFEQRRRERDDERYL